MSYIVHRLDAGRLGNTLLQIMSTIGMGKKFGRDFIFPKSNWKYQDYFTNQLPVFDKDFKTYHIQEPHFHYDNTFWEDEIGRHPENISVGTWLQSEKFFNNYKEYIKEILTFREDYKKGWKSEFPLFEQKKEIIAISVRIGKDYIDNGNYEILPIIYYILALEENFPNWRENYNVMIFSDEMSYCKSHFQGDNIFYGDGSDIKQLCLLTQCDHFILPNSTFGLVGAWLGEKPESKIIRPAYFFKGDLLKTHDIKDFWPERWETSDHKNSVGQNRKIPLKDITFTIPIFYDNSDREQNLLLSIEHLKKYFDTNILVGEQGGTHFQNKIIYDGYMFWNPEYMKEFHRTKMLNEMADGVDTPFIANWDADVLIPPLQVLSAVTLLRRGKADVVYPYDGRFARVSRSPWYRRMKDTLDVGIFKDEQFMGTRDEDQKSVGGAVFFNKESFIYGGMENENMINYGPEDIERCERFTRLGYPVARMKGILYHIDHYVGENSSINHPHFKANEEELKKEQAMTDEQLLEYVDSWTWVKKYSDKYYENIVDDAIKSGIEIFGVINKMFPNTESVLDISGGIGEFAVGAELYGYDYYLSDYRINRSKLLVAQYKYREFDLRTDISTYPFLQRYDLVINTEVAEHLSEEHADKLVELLCSKGETILFSAAIKYQGGLFHLNEQFQSYWVEKFEKYRYFPYKYDIREILRDNPKVCLWYRQNMMIFTKQEYIISYPIDVVLPEMYRNVVEHYKRKASNISITG